MSLHEPNNQLTAGNQAMPLTRCTHEHTAAQRTICRGFTLIELMLVILLLSIIALFATPGLSNWFGRNRIDATAHDFLSHLRYAQYEAIRRTQAVTLCRIDKAGQCSIAAQRCAKNHAAPQNWGCGYAIRIEGGTTGISSDLLKIEPLNGNVTINGSFAPLIFRPLTGQIIGGIRRFEFSPPSSPITRSSAQRCIYISVGGRARLTKGACKQT